MNLHYNYPILIDPNIKKVDKDFYLKLEQSVLNHGFRVVTNLVKSDHENLPTIIFNNGYTEEELLEGLGSNIVEINCLKHNFNLFDEVSNSENEFELNLEGEVESFLVLITDILSERIYGQHKVLIECCNKNLKKDLRETSRLEHQSESLRELESKFCFLNSDLNFLNEINRSLKNMNIAANLCSISEVKDFNSVYYLGLLDRKPIYFTFSSKDLVIEIYYLLLGFFKNQNLIIEEQKATDIWKNYFLAIETPIVALSFQSEILLNNSLFSKLNIPVTKVKNFQNQKQYEIMGENYRVVLKTTREITFYFFFKLNEKESTQLKVSNKELGIVSSSIAHELNNPLGGILAALDVLLLDELENELLVKLIEMKKSALRCKNLVQTFLGFSKLNVTLDNKASLNLEECSLQAIELVRFRLIESNINLNYNYNRKEAFTGVLYPSIIVILVYLIYGEVVTEFSHVGLVVKSEDKKIRIEIVERKQLIEINLDEGISLKSSFLNSKLFSHLLSEQRLHCRISNSKVILESIG